MRVQELWFASIGDGLLLVCGDTRCLDLKRMTKHRALVELQQIRDFFDDVLEICPDFLERSGKMKVRYALAYDYGMAAMQICADDNGEIQWFVDLEE